MNDPSNKARSSSPAARRRRASVALSVALSLATFSTTGCASLTASPDTSMFTAVDLDRPELQQFAVASMTDMERDVRLDTSDDGKDNPKLTPGLFWGGIILGSVGAAGAIGFGSAGFATKNQLNSGYEGTGDSFSQEERDSLVSRGEAFNTSAIAFTTAAVLGYALALVTYGVDWNRCGPLVHKRRRCKELNLAD